MKNWVLYLTIFVACMDLVNLGSGERKQIIKSVVYDFTISENELSGYCLIIGEEIGRISEYIELNSGFRVVEESTNELILRIENRTVDNEFTLPILTAPYKTEKTLIGVRALKKEKLVWKTLIKTKDGDDDKILVEESFDDSKSKQLDKDFIQLREKISGEKTTPEY